MWNADDDEEVDAVAFVGGSEPVLVCLGTLPGHRFEWWRGAFTKKIGGAVFPDRKPEVEQGCLVAGTADGRYYAGALSANRDGASWARVIVWNESGHGSHRSIRTARRMRWRFHGR